MIHDLHIAALDASSFETQVIAAPGLVLVDVTASWCTPCQRLGALLPKLAAEWNGHVTIYALDADLNRGICQRWSVTAFPQILLFDRGQLCGRIEGFDGYARLRNDLITLIRDQTGKISAPWPNETRFATRAETAEQAYLEATIPAAEAVGTVLEPYWSAHEAEITVLADQLASGEITAIDHATRIAAMNRHLNDLAAPELAAQRQATAEAVAVYRRAIGDATAAFASVKA